MDVAPGHLHVAPRLPMEQLLEALAAWERDPVGGYAGLTEAVRLIIAAWGAEGARIHSEAPPLPALTLEVGHLPSAHTDGDDDPGGLPPDSVERVRLLTGDGVRSTGLVEVVGTETARVSAARAITLALDLTWARSEARAAARRMDALDVASVAVAGELDLERVLQLIVDGVRPLVRARYAALGIVGPAGEFERFITSGIGEGERARIGHIPRGLGLLGQVVKDDRAIRTRDLMADPRRYGFPAHHPDMHSFLGVPVTVQGASVGNLYLTEKEGSGEFTDADERLVKSFARHAAIAIERARLHAQVQRLAVGQERERIGQDLHDGIIQALYAIGLSLEDVPDLMSEAPDDAAARVERAIDGIHAAIRDIRNFITGLRPEALDEGDLLRGLEELADQARRSGIETVVLAAAPGVQARVSDATPFLQAAREAVSNAIRHAQAARLELRLEVESDHVALTVVDDGRGFDPGASATQDARREHHGLRNLYARAQAMGGDAVVWSAPGRGTRILFRLPATGAVEASDD